MDNVLWWLDEQDEPHMGIYKALAKLIIEAKEKVLGREDTNERAREYEGDTDRTEALNAALIAMGRG